jgi:hypothetical protein
MNLIQKISSHSDAQKGKQKSLLWQKINKNRSQYIIKASVFYKIQNFFVPFKASILLVHERNVFVGVNTCINF